MSVAIENIPAENLSPNLRTKIERLRELGNAAPLITTNPNRMGGTPVIGIERLPVASLLSHLIAGYTVDEFIEAFDTDRERVYGILEQIKNALDARLAG